MIFAFHQRPKFKWLVLIEKAAEEDSSIPLFFVQYSIALLEPTSPHVSRHFICHLTWHLLRFFFSIRLFSFVLSLSFSPSTSSSSLLFFSSSTIECSRAKNSYKCEHMNKFNKRRKNALFQSLSELCHWFSLWSIQTRIHTDVNPIEDSIQIERSQVEERLTRCIDYRTEEHLLLLTHRYLPVRNHWKKRFALAFITCS